MLIRGVSVQLADIALGVNPAQGMEVADIELSGVVAQDHGSGNAPAIADRPPERALRGALHRVLHPGNAERFQMGPPLIAAAEAPPPMGGETRDHRLRQFPFTRLPCN